MEATDEKEERLVYAIVHTMGEVAQKINAVYESLPEEDAAAELRSDVHLNNELGYVLGFLSCARLYNEVMNTFILDHPKVKECDKDPEDNLLVALSVYGYVLTEYFSLLIERRRERQSNPFPEHPE